MLYSGDSFVGQFAWQLMISKKINKNYIPLEY
jgi:hypothetical protein